MQKTAQLEDVCLRRTSTQTVSFDAFAGSLREPASNGFIFWKPRVVFLTHKNVASCGTGRECQTFCINGKRVPQYLFFFNDGYSFTLQCLIFWLDCLQGRMLLSVNVKS